MAITYRLVKGSPLTFTETDNNFSYLLENMSGSIKITGSFSVTQSNIVLTDGGDNNTQTIEGNLRLTGDIIAEQYIVSSSVVHVTESYASGSHVFGDSMDDTHQFTGSVLITGSLRQGDSSNIITGDGSHAEGYITKASGDYSHTEGRNTTSSGEYSHAEGHTTTATGNNSHAEGEGGSLASGRSSHAEGAGTEAKGIVSHAEGTSTLASGQSAHSEGYKTTASGNYSHAEGHSSVASGWYSHAAGRGTSTNNQSYSYVGGLQVTASDYYGTYIGEFNDNINEEPGAQTLFQVGSGVSHAKRSNALTVGYSGSTETGTHYPFMVIPSVDSDGNFITTASYAAKDSGFPVGTMIWDNAAKKLMIKAASKYWFSSSFGKVID